MSSWLSRRALIAGAAALAASPVAAQAWPDRPIRLVVPFPPGALTDAIGRAIAERLRPTLNQPIVVENKPGAGTMLAAAQVAKAPPDGHTLMVATSTTLGISPFLYANPPYRIDELTGVAMVGNVTLFLVARPDFAATTVKELVEAVRARPGGYNYASPGTGTVHHLIVELLKTEQGLDVQHVPYQGSGPALTDVMTGRVDFMFVDATVAVPQIQAGKVRALAVTGRARSPVLPEVPAITETYPALDLTAWQAIAAPAGTPAPIVERLNREINAGLATEEFRTQLTRMGVAANPMGVAELNRMIAADAARWERLVRQSGAKAN